MIKLLELLEKNPNLSLEDMAVFLNKDTVELASEIDSLKEQGIILDTRTSINWDKVEGANKVKSYIFLNIRPQKDHGFDEIANKIASLAEVDTVELMSGSYDLFVEINGTNFQQIALFVSKKLSPIESVLSTATHFVLKTYKKNDILYTTNIVDKRVL